jgi:hypothetical protein
MSSRCNRAISSCFCASNFARAVISVLNRLDPVGDLLHQLAGGSVGISERALDDEFHRLAFIDL